MGWMNEWLAGANVSARMYKMRGIVLRANCSTFSPPPSLETQEYCMQLSVSFIMEPYLSK